MLDEKIVEAIDKRLREVGNKEQPFGGKIILMGGDCQQITPPSGEEKSIYSSKWMDLFNHVVLREQVRQKDDPEFFRMLTEIGQGLTKWVLL